MFSFSANDLPRIGSALFGVHPAPVTPYLSFVRKGQGRSTHAIGAESFFGRPRLRFGSWQRRQPGRRPLGMPGRKAPCFSIWAIDYMWTATSDWLEWDEIEAVEIE